MMSSGHAAEATVRRKKSEKESGELLYLVMRKRAVVARAFKTAGRSR